MGRWLVVVVALLGTNGANAATVTWDNSSGDGLWTTATNWSGNVLPNSDDDVFFDGNGSDDACLVTSNQTVGTLHAVNGYTGTVTINAGVTLTTASSVNFSVIAAGTWVVGGTLFFSNTTFVAFNGGTITLDGIIEMAAPFQTAAVAIGGSGTLRARKDVSFGGGQVPSGTWTLEMAGTTQSLFSNTASSVNRIVITPTSTTSLPVTPTLANVISRGDVVVQAGGKLDLSAGLVALDVRGNLQIANAAGMIPGTAAIVLFAGTTQTLTTNGAPLPKLVVNPGSTLTLQDNATVESLTLHGAFNPAGHTTSVKGDLTASATGSMLAMNAGTVKLIGSGDQHLTLATTAVEFNVLSVETAGAVTVDGELRVQGSFNVARTGPPATLFDLGASAFVNGMSIGAFAELRMAVASSSLSLGDDSGRMFDVLPGGVVSLIAPSGVIAFGNNATLRVQAGGRMTMMGQAGAELGLHANGPGRQWNLVDDSAAGTGFASLYGSGPPRTNPSFVKVSNSTGSGTAAPIRPGGSIDQGGNVNWSFADLPPGVPDAGLVLLDGGGPPSATPDLVSPYGCSVAPRAHNSPPWPFLLTLIALAFLRRLEAR